LRIGRSLSRRALVWQGMPSSVTFGVVTLGIPAILLALSGSVPLVGADPGIGSGDIVSLQNQRIYCFGGSMELGVGGDPGEGYPDHLRRLLGRTVDYGDIDLMPGASDEILEAVSLFGKHKYGIIVVRAGYDGPSSGIPWNVTEGNLRRMIRRLQNSGALVVFFEAGPVEPFRAAYHHPRGMLDVSWQRNCPARPPSR
jgi:hypothetical protein